MEGRPTTVVGFYGSVLDGGPPARRWDRWRPSVSLVGRDDLVVARFVLLCDAATAAGAQQVARDMREVSPETDVVLREVAIDDPWDFEEVYGALYDVAADLAVDPDREDLLVHITTGTHVEQICLFLLTESRHFPGRLVQTSPPRRRETPARGGAAVIDLDLSRYDRLASRFERERQAGESVLKSGIATRNAPFNATVARIERVAVATRAPILLLGPTGAGKSLLARRIYDLKRQRRGVTGAFVELNCATIKGDAAMSALFGHAKGAFTGAVAERAGLLRAADGGVLFLDEVGELGADEQAMLLRALEERRFLPLGSDKETSSDFQLIAGTNRDLRADVASGRFRRDLLARIDLWTFSLPPLRERPEDVEPNLDFELEAASRTLERRVTMSREARAAFLAFATSARGVWAGNFRDLNAAVLRMATLASGGRVTEADVREEVARLEEAWAPVAPASPTAADDDLLAEVLPAAAVAALDRFDRVQLADVVRVCRGARSLADAGRTLFAASRARRSSHNDSDRLRKYLARFGVEAAALFGRPS
ncbi:MAG: sigma 54-interacting transcriptional regulator [Planctomycetes bacterium]|nr:sigma 54-interacting transcriptional regulator [Planctomycetota bacterium]